MGVMSGEPRELVVELQAKVERLERTERRMELLLDVTGELGGARSSEDVARIAIDQGISAVGAALGGIWTLDLDGRALRLLSASRIQSGDLAKWTEIPLELDAPVTQVLRDGEPIFFASTAAYEARYPASFVRMRELIAWPDASFAVLPLVGHGPPLGALVLSYRSSGEPDPAARTFLAVLARQTAFAIERVRLHEAERAARTQAERAEREVARAYREEREAHLHAEEATRAREEILSVVSHDLRNPLGTILMGASTLLQLCDGADPKAQRIRTVSERIHRQSERMARLIDDLVDFAGIHAGKLLIQRSRHAPAAIIASAAELFTPLAQERGLLFDAYTTPDLPMIEVDAERAVQVLSNLMTNAMKVTGRGGRIAIGALPDLEATGDVVFFVRDTGPGIDADELPRLFERYWRSKKASYRGAGLGLSIARGIVDAHGGRIWAESQVGNGSSFYFTLASRAP